MAVNYLTLTTTPIILRKGTEFLSQGTGFYFTSGDEENKILFLVTNYHVVTGSSPAEKKLPMGDNIEFQFHKSEENIGDTKSVSLPLYNKECKPIWITSKNTPQADMVVIPILPTSLYDGCVFNSITEKDAEESLRVRPTSSVTLIGYPYGFYDKKNALPIYKTGSVASEPNIDFEGNPLFLIDISAFPGMSGSPAFAIAYGTFEHANGDSMFFGRVEQFLGIYSSMQMLNGKNYLKEFTHDTRVGIETSLSLELGYVWKAKLIIETINEIDIVKYEKEILNCM